MSATTAGQDVVIDILDVGHGSCVAIRSGGSTSLIDTGPNSAVLEYLTEQAITSLETVIVSHADRDHIGGLSALLSAGFPIDRVVWNGDGAKRSEIWRDLVYQLDDLERSGIVIASDEAADGQKYEMGRTCVEILAPRLRLRRLGPGAIDSVGSRISTNSVSVVVRVSVDEESVLIVPGDLDAVGFAHLSDPSLPDLSARYLVVPHHGGLMGSDSATSALIGNLVGAVSPEAVIVSNGRGRYGNPRASVIESVRVAAPTAAIACTQLSVSCHLLAVHQAGSPSAYSDGWLRGHSCAATIRLSDGAGIGAPRTFDEHERFINDFVSEPICRQ